MNFCVLLAMVLGVAAAGPALAQPKMPAAATPPPAVAVDDTLAAAVGTSYLNNTVRGFGRAEILGPDGKTHFVWIPVNPMGFSKYLPFHRSEEDAGRFGREPFSIDVDKVQSIKVNGLYQEHIVLKGKRKHLLATRVVNGPVELFNYTEMMQPTAMVPVGGLAGGMVMGGMGLGGYPNRSWYLRRPGGELIKVERVEFVNQMTAFFHDDPELVAALRESKLHYREMVQVVQAYNEYRTRPAAK